MSLRAPFCLSPWTRLVSYRLLLSPYQETTVINFCESVWPLPIDSIDPSRLCFFNINALQQNKWADFGSGMTLYFATFNSAIFFLVSLQQPKIALHLSHDNVFDILIVAIVPPFLSLHFATFVSTLSLTCSVENSKLFTFVWASLL